MKLFNYLWQLIKQCKQLRNLFLKILYLCDKLPLVCFKVIEYGTQILFTPIRDLNRFGHVLKVFSFEFFHGTNYISIA